MKKPEIEIGSRQPNSGESRLRTGMICILLMIAASIAEKALGRRLWGIQGEPGLWCGDIFSSHNSQFLADPYTFTHLIHGAILYGLLRLFLKSKPVESRGMIAVALESLWEIIENSDPIIERYRAATMSLNYYGDSIVNSMGDILACGLGFYLASRLPPRAVLIGCILIEVGLALTIRDGLVLNILMLAHPLPGIAHWQLVR